MILFRPSLKNVKDRLPWRNSGYSSHLQVKMYEKLRAYWTRLPAFLGNDLHCPSPCIWIYLVSNASSLAVHGPLCNPTFEQQGALPIGLKNRSRNTKIYGLVVLNTETTTFEAKLPFYYCRSSSDSRVDFGHFRYRFSFVVTFGNGKFNHLSPALSALLCGVRITMYLGP